MNALTRVKRFRQLPGAWLIATASMLCGACVSPFGTPTLKHGVVSPFRKPPEVKALVTHTNCEIATAMAAARFADPSSNYDAALWKRLSDDNFVATVDFTLTATNNEGFDPSVSWISPLTSQGHFISVVPSQSQPPPMGQPQPTMGTYNRTLAVGIQANASQDRNFDLTYLLDLHRLYSAVMDGRLYEICGYDDKGSRTSEKGLDGDLNLGETIDFGLKGLQQGASFAYGAQGPIPPLDSDGGSPPTAALAPVRRSTPMALNSATPPPDHPTGAEGMVKVALGPRQVAAATADPAAAPPAAISAESLQEVVVAQARQTSEAASGKSSPAAPQATNTTFSSKIDFTIVQGLNGGPSWTLLKWKVGGGSAGGAGGGAGGAGGSGGGGGGAAGAGGAGAGAGGGGQLLNWSRTVLDTLTITFSPTCSSERTDLRPEPPDPKRNLWGFSALGDRGPVSAESFAVTLPPLSLPETFSAIVAPRTASQPSPSSPTDPEKSPQGGKPATREKEHGNPRKDDAGANPNPQKVQAPAKEEYFIRVQRFVNERYVYGSIQWRGFTERTPPPQSKAPGSPPETGTALGTFELVGTISDPATGNTTGAIVLSGILSTDDRAQITEGHVTGDPYAALSGGAESSDYWGSIQSCDLSSSAQIQAAVKNASDTNTLFKLSNFERTRLQQ
jgi:hypothetical protein